MQETRQQEYFGKPHETDEEVEEQIRQNKRIIPVSEGYENIHQNYVKQGIEFDTETVYFLISESVFNFIGGAGEGDIDEGIAEIRDAYNELKQGVEKEMLKKGKTSVQESYLATTMINAYETYLVNKLTKNGKAFDEEVLDELGLNTKEAEEKCKSAAVKQLGKSISEIKKAKLKDLLIHKNVYHKYTKKLTREEMDEVLCHYGSHWEIKKKYKGVQNDGTEYGFGRDAGRRVGSQSEAYKKVNVSEKLEVRTNTSVDELVDEISKRSKAPEKIEDDVSNLIKMYINLKHIMAEDPNSQIPIIPKSELI